MYTKTEWIDKSNPNFNSSTSPATNAENFNKIESELHNLSYNDYTNVWRLYTYADEEIDRVLGMDPVSMTLAREVDLPAGAHAGSCDRAGFTDKMYVRTTGSRDIDVIDLQTGTWLRKITLNYKPRSSGGFNQYRGLQAISTKENPYVNVIDVATDKVVITVGADGGAPDGNDGGNATGHTVWLDGDHFAILDRHANEIRVYKVNEAFPPYTTTLTDTVDTLTGCHSLRSVEAGLLLQDRVFYAAIEGSSGGSILPQMWKLTFSSATGQFTKDVTMITFPDITIDWNIHHFGLNSAGTLMAVPVSISSANGEVFTIDLDTWALTGHKYIVGLGSGHADFSNQLNLCVITNHYGNTVSIIDLTLHVVTNVVIATGPEVYGTYIQSHANHVSEDGLFYYFFETALGIFMEIDLTTKTLTRQVTTGGKPIQSVS